MLTPAGTRDLIDGPQIFERRPRPCLWEWSPMLTWMRRPTSVIGGKADMARTCQYVR